MTLDPLKPDLELVVLGIPATAGNKTAFPFVKGWKTGKTGKPQPVLGVLITEGGGKDASALKVRQWRSAISARVLGHPRGAPLDGPLLAFVDFYLEPLKTGRRLWPWKKPDYSKLLRALEDPVVSPAKGFPGLIADDSRIVYVVGGKFYAEERAGARGPRAELRIWQLPDDVQLPLETARQAFLAVLLLALGQCVQPSLSL